MIEELKQKAFDAIFHFDMKEAREIAKEIEFRVKNSATLQKVLLNV